SPRPAASGSCRATPTPSPSGRCGGRSSTGSCRTSKPTWRRWLPADVIVADEVAAALAAGRPVVALESTIISHGLPRPDNLEVARQIEATVRDHGAVPATIAVVDGRARIGLDDAALDT